MVDVKCAKCGVIGCAQLDVDDDETEPLCPTCAFVKTHCKECGRKVDGDNVEFDPEDGSTRCEKCFHEHYETCEDCDVAFPVDRMTTVHRHKSYGSGNDEEVLICEKCLSNYRTCGDCGLWHEEGRTRYLPRIDKYICGSCYENDFFTCDSCGEVFINDDYGDDGCCRSCDSDRHREDAVEEADVSEVFNVNRSIGTINFKHDPEVDRILADPKSEL